MRHSRSGASDWIPKVGPLPASDALEQAFGRDQNACSISLMKHRAKNRFPRLRTMLKSALADVHEAPRDLRHVFRVEARHAHAARSDEIDAVLLAHGAN